MRRVKSLVSFYTIIPVKEHSMEDAADLMHLSPLIIGIIVGGIVGLLSLVLSIVIPAHTLCILILSMLLIITGFSHVDGLMDLADALMFKGSREERLRVLHDKYSGSAAVITVFIVEATSLMCLLSILSIVPLIKFPLVIMIIEVMARTPHVILAYLGPPPTYKGLGYLFVNKVYRDKTKIKILFITTMPVLLLLALITGLLWRLLIALIVMLILTWVYKAIIVRAIGFITGDVLGASIEVFRAIMLLVFTLKIPC